MQELGQLMRSSFNECGPTNVLLGKQIENIDQLSELRAEMWRDATQEFVPDRELFQEWREESLRSSRRLEEQRLRLFQLDLERQKQFESQLQAGPAGKVVPGFNVTPEAAATPKSDGVGTPISAGEGRKASDIVVAPPPADVDVTSATVEIVDTATAEADLRAIGKEQALLFFQEQSHLCSSTAPASDDNSTAVEGGPSRHNSRIAFYVEPPLFAGTTPREDGEFSWASQSDGSQYFANSGPYQGQAQRPVAADERKLQQLVSQGRVPITHDPSCVFVETKLKNTRHHATHPQGPRPQVRSTADSPSNKSPAPAWWWDTSTDNGGLPLANLDTLIASPWQLGSAPTVTLEESAKYKTGARNSGLDVVLPPFEYALDELSATAICSGKEVRSEPPQTQKTMKELLTDELDSMLPPTASESQFDASPALGIPSSSRGHSLGAASDAQQTGADEENPEHPLQASPAEKEAERTNGVRVRKSQEMEKILVAEKASMTEFNQDLIANLLPPTGEVLASANLSNSGNPKPMNSSRRIEAIDETAQRIGTVHDLNESHLALLLPHLSPAEVGNALLHPAASPQRSSLKEKSLTEQPSRQEKDAPPPEHLHTLEHFHSQVASLDRTLPPMDYDLRDSPAAQNRETNTDVHSRHPDIASVHKHIIDSHADHRVFDSKQEEAAPQPLVSAAQPLLPAVPQVAAVDASEQKRNTESLSALESEFTSMKQAQTKLREEMEQSMRSEVEEMRAQLRAQMQQEREAQQKTAELQELERRKQNEVAQTARAEQEEVQKQLQAEMAEKMKAEVEAMKKSLQQEIEQKVLPVQALAVEAAEKLQAVSATAAEQAGAPARPENQDPEPARPTSYALLKSLRDEQDELQKSLRTEVSAKMQAEVEALKKALQEEIEQKILPVQSIAEAAAKTQAQQVLESQQAARNDAADFAAVQERQQEQQRLLREEMAAVLRTKVEEMKTSLQEEMAQKILPVQSLAEEAARRSSKPEQGEQHPADQNPVASAEALQAIKDELRTELQEQITSTNVVSPPAAPSASTEAQLQALKDELRTELHEQIRHVSSSPHHHVENQHNGATNGTGPLTEELQEKLRHELQASIETELHQARATLKRQMEEELEAERKAVEHEMELKRERLKTEFDQEKETLLKTLERERKVLHTEVDQEKRLLTVEFEKQQKLLDQSLQQERDRLHEQFATERRSIEESLGKEKAVLERGVEKEREALQKQFEKEHQELQLQLQKQQQRLDETLHEDREKLTQELVEKQKAMELSLQKAEREVEQERKQIAQQMKDESEAMQREFHQLAKEIHATRDHTAQELATEFGEHRAALQKELAREQEKLQKDLRRDQEHLQAELHEEQVHLREELQAQERSLQEEFRAEERKAQQLLETKIHEGQSALGLKARKMEEELAEEISRTREDIHRANREEEDRLEDERAQLREQMRLQREQIQQRLEEERMEVAHELEQDKREWRERRLKQHEEELREKMTENISAQLQQDLARHLGARDRRLQHNSELLPAGGGVTSFALHDSEGELIGSRATLIDDLHPHLGARHSKSRRSHSRGGSALEEEQALDMLLESTMRHRHRRRERERSAIADGDVLQLTQKTDHLLRSRDGIAAREHAGAHRHTRASKSPKTSQHLHSGKYSRLGPDFDHDQYLNHNDYSNLNDELISSKASSHRRELLDFLCVANGTTTRGASLAGPNKYLAGTSLAHLNVRPQLRDLIQAPAPHLGGRHPGRHVGEGEAMLKDEDVPERPVQIEIEDRTRSHVEQDEHAQSQKVLLQTVDALIPDEGSGRSGAKAGGPLRKPGPPESDESDFANHPNWLEGSSEDDRAPVVSAQIRTPPTSLPVVSLLPKAAASAGLSQPAGQHTDFESDMSERPPVTTSEDDDLAVGTTIQYFAENSRMWIPGRVMAKTSSLKGSHLYSVRVFHGAGNHKEEVNIENLPRDRLRRKKPYAGVVANSYSAHDPKKNNHGHPQHNGQGQHGEHLDVEQEDSKKPRQEGEAGPYDVGHLDDERF
ncbi:unnamed protein product [Amoebophrya sp. A120]|nr:unnamed protein product [Amoebophrya sp. A120]|eukprot:GSA120T00004147001.1